MISVEEAEQAINSRVRNYGTENVFFEDAAGRILAEDIKADRDLPPYNRVTMDGIAARYSAIEKGNSSFIISATQAAGDTPAALEQDDACIEIMTGAALPPGADTVIPYEHVLINNGVAVLREEFTVVKGQNIHTRAVDKKQYETLVKAGRSVDATVINVAAAVGKTTLLVNKLPRIVVVSTGDELVAVDETPQPYQVRRSNSYAIQALLAEYGIKPRLLHLPDNPQTIKEKLQACLDNYDIILLSGGVSIGKFDYVPQVLDGLGIAKLFHKVRQRPGKPFWFGEHGNGTLVFAFPGNPVSTFACMVRYCIPWLAKCMGLAAARHYAVLDGDIACPPALQCFIPVLLSTSTGGTLMAGPITGNGSGDFAGLVLANAFIELPSGQGILKKGGAYRVWPFKTMFNER